MARDEEDTPIVNRITPSFERMSVDELADYIGDLQNEIKKVDELIKAKKQAEVAANSVFKK